MGRDASDARVNPGDAEAPRSRPRPKPPRRGTDTNENARRRLGRFFADDRDTGDGGSAVALPDHFPGVPRPESITVDAPAPPPRPRPQPPAASRPRPPRKPPQPR